MFHRADSFLKNKVRGFTLIELLIVIAIILILIAIALPNFLEAQMRAKVARAEGEMRGLATAIESYRTDYRRYPPNAFYEKTQFNPTFPLPVNVYGLMQLTTPVKYITQLPLDPFVPQDGVIKNGSNGDTITPSAPDKAHGLTYFYWSQESLRVNFQTETADAMKNNGINWVLLSVGPDSDLDTINLDPNDMGAMRIGATKWTYNPTNGSKSSGDISRARP
jgi:prepilin-type N-terminal cleavage/methylation domain-containing protein